MSLLKTVTDFVTGKKKKEAEFSKNLLASDVSDFMTHIDEKGFQTLDVFQNLIDTSDMSGAKNWLESFSRTLFDDNPQRKMAAYQKFCTGNVSDIPPKQRSKMAVYMMACHIFLMQKEADDTIRETRRHLARQMRQGRRMRQKAETKMARAEKDMVAVDKMIEKGTAKMEKMMFGRSSQKN